MALIPVPTPASSAAPFAPSSSPSGTDRYPDLETAVERTVSADRTHEPRPDHEAFYAEWYDLYTDTYEAMFEPWAKRADLLSRLDPPE
jgi:hypothetical protein